MLAQRRKDHENEMNKLDKDSQVRMNQYRAQIEDFVAQRQKRI